MLSESDTYRLGGSKGKRRKLVRSELYHGISWYSSDRTSFLRFPLLPPNRYVSLSLSICSDAELTTALSALGANEYNSGFVQNLHMDTITEVIDAIVVQLAPLGDDALLSDTTETLSGVFPETVLAAVMRMFETSNKALCPKKLSRHRARLMFESSGSWLERTFIASWKGSLEDLGG